MSVFDVVIVGCGPVGALAANLLGRHGLSVIVLEQGLELHPLPRAVHLDHEAMRLLQDAGVIDSVLPDMVATDGHMHIGADHGVIRYMGTMGKPRPFGWANDYFFYQPELEAHLRNALRDLQNVELKLGCEVIDLSQQADVATLNFLRDGEVETVTARWVVACDGSKSTVRKALGVELDDLDFEEPWLVVDAEVEGPVTFPPLLGVPESADLQRLSVMMCDPKRPATIVPGRGTHRRWEFMLLPGEDDEVMMAPDAVQALIGPWVQNVPHRIVRAATYRFHGLVARQWKVGAVFLAGDAAHQTPPFFGQGMCHGFRDVANLAWKIAQVAQGVSAPSILDTYQPERDPHVRSVIHAAVAAGRYICELDPEKAGIRDRERRAQSLQTQGETAHDLIPAISTGIILNESSAAGERFIQPATGEALLDDFTGGGWRLFFRNCGSSGASSDVAVFDADTLPDDGAVRRWLDDRDVNAVLVRPDHYVFGTTRLDVASLCEARDERFGISEEQTA